MRHTLFISDIHLDAKRADITQCFLSFLSTQAPQADALYILGDLFEVWIGDDDNTPFHQTIRSAIKALSNNIPVYFMRGNRDFLIGEQFARQTGCIILPDPSTVNLYGKQVLLSHGDMLCTHDIKHQKFRTLSQNSRYNRYFLCLPLPLRKWIARIIRNKSQKYMRTIDVAIMDVTQDAVDETMRDKQVDLLIHGHTHRPYIHQMIIGEQSAARIVLGDWHQKGSVLVYNEDHTCMLETIPFSTSS